MSLKIFQKPRLELKEEKKILLSEITDLQIKYEKLGSDYQKKEDELERIFQEKHTEKERQISELENILAGKRKEYAQLVAPLKDREHAIAKKEIDIENSLEELGERIRLVDEKEIKADQQMDLAEDMATKLGQRSLSLDKRENALIPKEQILKVREGEFMLRVIAENDRIAKEQEKNAQERAELDGKIVAIQAREENIAQREKQNKDELELIKSKREALLAAQKQHVSS